MTDPRDNRDLIRTERQFAIADARRYAADVIRGDFHPRHGRLSEEEAASRKAEAEAEARAADEAAAVAAREEQCPREPIDPEAPLRHARIGMVAAAVLILMLVWLMQRRK